MKDSKLLFSWNPATTATNSLPIEYYELREGGTSWADATFIANIPASASVLQYLYGIINTTELATTPVGTLKYNQEKIFRIASKDSFGLTSTTQNTISVTLTKPSAISSLALNVVGPYINATWTPIITGILSDVYTLPIDRYEIRATRSALVNETIWNNATSLASLSGTAVALDPPINPSIDPLNNADGTWYYLIRAYDSFNMAGALSNKQLNIGKPSIPVNFANKVIDNNILLNWEDSAVHTFPIATFMLKKSLNSLATYTEAQTVGTKSGGFTTVFEESSGTFSYFLTAVDTAGNISDMARTTAIVNQPPDYVLTGDIYRDNFNISTYGSNTVTQTLANVVKSDSLGSTGVNKIIGPMSPSQTFDSHFTGNSWTNIQDQPNAGYPVYAQPSITGGFSPFTVISITGSSIFTSSTVHGLSVGDKISSMKTPLVGVGGYGLVQFTTYYVQSIPSTTSFTLSTTSSGPAITSFTNGSGLSIVMKPPTGSGTLTEVIDYGIIFNTNQYVSIATDISNMAGTTGTYQIILSTSSDGINYTSATSAINAANVTNLVFGTFALNFRYVKVQIILNSNTTGIDLLRVNSYRLKLSLKYTNDGGSGSVSTDGIYQVNLLGGGSGYTSEPTVTIGGNGLGAKARAIISGGVVTSIEVINSGSGYTSILPANISITGGGGTGASVASIVKTSATSGTIVAFNYNYLDVSGIQITYGGITPGIAIYDFVDITYPKFFRVLLFNNSGTPITGNFSWSAKGTI